MRSIAFFLIVFSSLLLALYLIVEKEPEGSIVNPDVEDSAGQPAAESIESKNTIELPFYDVEKGRLAWWMRGELPPDAFKIVPDLQSLDHIVLLNGEIRIPIYEELAENLPAVDQKKASLFRMRFRRAEYQKVVEGRKGDREEIHLREGGTCVADDGTEITFEELDITIERRDKYVYLISSRKPISIGNSLLVIESASGFTGKVQEDSDLEKITFIPPVRTYITASSARLFALDLPESASGEPGPGEKEPEDEEGDAGENRKGIPGKVAVTCEGPLILDRTTTPPRIEYRDEVHVFPVDTVEAGKAPKPADTWFHFQKLTLLIEDEKDRPPVVSEAVGSWEGGRVKASYRGFLSEGDTLRWKNLGPLPGDRSRIRSEAVLTGRPSFRGETVSFHADTAFFKLEEKRILLEGNVDGAIHLKEEAAGDGSGDPGREEGTDGATEESPKETRAVSRGIPREWDFRADGVDLLFAGADGRDGDAEERGKERRGRKREGKPRKQRFLSDLEPVARFVASAEGDQGLILKSRGDERFQLEGKRLLYDRQTQQVTVEGGAQHDPRFQHDSSEGSAEKIFLMLEQDLLRLDRNVSLRVAREDLGKLKKDEPSKQKDGDAAPSVQDAPSPGEPGAGAPENLLAGGLEIAGDQIDVQLDENYRIHSATARSLGDRPITVHPLDREDLYKIHGPSLFWDNVNEVALMDGKPVSSGAGPASPVSVPILEFQGGMLIARKIRFDRKRWLATLEEGVEIRSHLGAERRDESGPASVGEARRPTAPGRPLVIVAGSADVEFFEWFRPPESRGGGCFLELERVRRIHARAVPGKTIDIAASTYSADAREAVWDSESQELRLFGEGGQVFRRIVNDEADALLADEVTYRRKEGLILLRGNVSGKFYQWNSGGPEAAADGEPGPIPGLGVLAGESSGGIPWDFTASAVDIRVRETADCRTLEMVSLEARERVFLECKAQGVQLQGDDLEYDHGRQEVRVFSRDGRYQTLSHTRRYAGDSGPEIRTNKIDAREIRVWYMRDPALRGATGEEKDHIVVKFSRDVTAAFYGPSGSELLRTGEKPEKLEEWKLRANHMGLRILRGREPRRMVQFAYAQGDVDFTSREMRAMASEAIYEEEMSRLILAGDSKNLVRLHAGQESISEKIIILSRRGSHFRIESRGRQPRRPPAVGVLGPDRRRAP